MIRSLIALSVLLLPASLVGQEVDATQRLSNQSKQFVEQIIRVSDNVYTAVGYTVSNVSMIVGTDGVVIIDAGMMLEDVERIAEAFREISDKPVKAIVLTHSHGDHTGGAAAFLSGERPQIWAHENFGSEARPLDEAGVTFQRVRGARQAGFKLPPEQRVNNGIAPVRYPNRGGGVFASDRKVRPTHFLKGDRATVKIAGIELELVSSPGETNDQLFVWYPADKVLFSGDNFYRSFPNLYAIRGTPNRNVKRWYESLEKLQAYGAEALVGGHTNPVIGESRVKEVLRNYVSAVQWIHDKTVEGINQGLTPNELVDHVKLPPEFDELEYLQPFYGHPAWGVRTVFSGYLGWFDGNPTNLFPLSPRDEAEKMAQLVGGQDKLVAAAETALKSGDAQWAAQLADHLMALDPDDAMAKRIKADALSALAEATVNATARNYYLTVAQELREETPQGKSK